LTFRRCLQRENATDAMAATLGIDAEGASNGSLEAAMLGLLQQQMALMLNPVVAHVDQLFTAVESLGNDLAHECARSKGQHEEISLHLSDIDKNITPCLMKVANDVDRQRELDIVIQAQLDRWFTKVLEPTMQGQIDRQEDRVMNLYGQMPQLLTSYLQAALEQHQAMISRQMDSFSSRLSVAEADIETTASVLQEAELLIGALQNEIVVVCAQTEAKLGDALESALKEVQQETRLEFSGLEERFGAVAATAAAAECQQVVDTKQVVDTMQQVVDTMQQHLSHLSASEEICSTKVADIQSITSALQLSLQQRANDVHEIAVQLAETSHIITNKLEPAIETQRRKMFDLESAEQDKLNGLQSRLHKLLEFRTGATSGRAATSGRRAKNLESSHQKHSKGLATSEVMSARVAADNRSEASVGTKPACRVQEGGSLSVVTASQAQCLQMLNESLQDVVGVN